MQLGEQHWQALQYDSIRANTVTESAHGLQIAVDASASPLIYVFDEAQTIHQVSVMGILDQLPAIPPGLKQGQKGADDFPFRLGLVIEGDKTLSFAQHFIAAQWVKLLFGLAPEESGIEQIMFLNLANADNGTSFATQREHPNSGGLYTETIVSQVSADENFDFNYTLPLPVNVIALWISSDGDDTGSSYSLTVTSISYH